VLHSSESQKNNSETAVDASKPTASCGDNNSGGSGKCTYPLCKNNGVITSNCTEPKCSGKSWFSKIYGWFREVDYRQLAADILLGAFFITVMSIAKKYVDDNYGGGSPQVGSYKREHPKDSYETNQEKIKQFTKQRVEEEAWKIGQKRGGWGKS
jgi:hypothetical protein